tara:strand:- start:16582 stop:18624 length:2043 start_codon:yes stop_codon:yes gene_type:complete
MIKKAIFVGLLSFVIIDLLKSQSIQELQKMKEEYERLKNNSNLPLPPGQLDSQNLNNIGTPNEANLLRYFEVQSNVEDSVDAGLKHFGYDFFSKRDTVSFWENLPTPKDYLLGPGDELVISLWGETQMRQTYVVDREGNIYDDKVGLVSMVGKSIYDGEKLLKEKFSSIFSTLRSNNPTSYLNLSLGKLRSINVSFVGEVNYPGVYPVHPFSTLITGLIQAGGIDTLGSLREIIIKRSNKDKTIKFDFYDYLLNGNIANKIQLRDQDIILVRPRLSTISIDSAVVRPGIYEFVNGENINQLINYAGGLKPDASSMISLDRIQPINKRNKTISPTESYYIDYNSSKKIIAQNGDYLTVRYINNSKQKVEIIGRGKTPNSFHYYDKMTLYDLISISGILEDLSFLNSIHLDRAVIVRKDPSTRYEKIINVNLKEIRNDLDKAKDFNLKNLDRFILNENSNFIEKDFVNIYGEAMIPGSYPLIKDKENLKSVLTRAGGLTDKALSNGISIFRQKKYFNVISNENKGIESNYQNIEEINNPNESQNINTDRIRVAWQNEEIILMPGDSVVVRQKTGTINIFGEVYNPGLLEYETNKPLRYYVNAAGGITNQGDEKDIIVIYANGVVNPKKWYSSPKIEDGCTIIVNPKANQVPFNITQFATNWTSILSSLITAVILSQQIGGSN